MQCFASSPQTKNCSRSSPVKSGLRIAAAVVEVFKPLILMNACAWIGAHNHPSGDVGPSQEDRVLTIRLRQGADLLDIILLDHLILTDEHSYSFADQGWPDA